MAGARFVMTVDNTSQLSDFEAEGTMCWDYQAKLMMVFDQGGWRALTASPGDIFGIMTYDYQKESAILNIGDVYQPIITLTTPARPAGLYYLGLSYTYTFPDTNDSVFLRWRVDGSAWQEITSEPKDIQDVIPGYYAFPKQYVAGVHVVEVEARKTTGGNQFDMNFIDVFFQRIGI